MKEINNNKNVEFNNTKKYYSKNSYLINNNKKEYWRLRDINNSLKLIKLKHTIYSQYNNQIQDKPIINKRSNKITKSLNKFMTTNNVFERLDLESKCRNIVKNSFINKNVSINNNNNSFCNKKLTCNNNDNKINKLNFSINTRRYNNYLNMSYDNSLIFKNKKHLRNNNNNNNNSINNNSKTNRNSLLNKEYINNNNNNNNIHILSINKENNINPLSIVASTNNNFNKNSIDKNKHISINSCKNIPLCYFSRMNKRINSENEIFFNVKSNNKECKDKNISNYNNIKNNNKANINTNVLKRSNNKQRYLAEINTLTTLESGRNNNKNIEVTENLNKENTDKVNIRKPLNMSNISKSSIIPVTSIFYKINKLNDKNSVHNKLFEIVSNKKGKLKNLVKIRRELHNYVLN